MEAADLDRYLLTNCCGPMLEKPDLPDSLITGHLADAYGLPDARVEFLPLGADVNTAAYRASAADRSWFVKLWKAGLIEDSLRLLHLLHQNGNPAIIAPVETLGGRLWSELADYNAALFPFIPGQDGYRQGVTGRQWSALGSALKAVHATRVPPEIEPGIARETFTPDWRNSLGSFLGQLDRLRGPDEPARRLIALLHNRHKQILELVERAEQLAEEIGCLPMGYVLCHADLHLGNILLSGTEQVYIVDWDAPVFAPVERDLMFVGGGRGMLCNTLEEEARFYRGYGPVSLRWNVVAYYRFERIVQDMAVYCRELLLSEEGGSDRLQSYRYFASNFDPGGTIESAWRADGWRG